MKEQNRTNQTKRKNRQRSKDGGNNTAKFSNRQYYNRPVLWRIIRKCSLDSRCGEVRCKVKNPNGLSSYNPPKYTRQCYKATHAYLRQSRGRYVTRCNMHSISLLSAEKLENLQASLGYEVTDGQADRYAIRSDEIATTVTYNKTIVRFTLT